MKKILLAVAALAACSHQTLPPRVVEGKAPLKAGREIVLNSNKGSVKIVAGKPGELTWKAELSPDQSFGPAVTEKDYDASKIAFDAEKGLTIDAVNGVSVKVTVSVPEKEALKAELQAGILDIGPRTGSTNAFIGAGTLDYDASALPAKTCVTASINAGSVSNNRDFACASVGAVLHGHAGTIKVK